MKYRKTYGMEGLLEWHGSVNCGGVRMKVSFTNGSATAWGVSPATFTTEDKLTQHIMENSDMYKDGRIKLLRSVELLDYLKDIVTDVTSEDIAEIQKPKLDQIRDVYNCSDATLWLKEHKGVNTVGKNKRQIIEIAATHGVEFPALMQ